MSTCFTMLIACRATPRITILQPYSLRWRSPQNKEYIQWRSRLRFWHLPSSVVLPRIQTRVCLFACRLLYDTRYALQLRIAGENQGFGRDPSDLSTNHKLVSSLQKKPTKNCFSFFRPIKTLLEKGRVVWNWSDPHYRQNGGRYLG